MARKTRKGGKGSGSSSPLSIDKLLSVLEVFFKGLASAFKHEGAFRREALVAAVAIPTALMMNLPGSSKAVMILCIMLIMIFELANTAVEALADKISDKNHILLGKAKDVGSTAVGLMKVTTVLVWVLILWF